MIDAPMHVVHTTYIPPVCAHLTHAMYGVIISCTLAYAMKLSIPVLLYSTQYKVDTHSVHN